MALIVHGPNSDVDLVNELAQQQRLDSGELGQPAIRAVDRDYLLHPGDVVAAAGKPSLTTNDGSGKRNATVPAARNPQERPRVAQMRRSVRFSQRRWVAVFIDGPHHDPPDQQQKDREADARAVVTAKES